MRKSILSCSNKLLWRVGEESYLSHYNCLMHHSAVFSKNMSAHVDPYATSFVCVLISAVWYKILARIGNCNYVIQARNATLDVEVSNFETLLADLTKLRNWKCMWNEAKVVASNVKIEIKLSRGCGGVRRLRARLHVTAHLMLTWRK